MGSISVKYPLVLIIAIPILFTLIFFFAKSLAGLSRWRYWVTFLLRTISCLFLIFALADTSIVMVSKEMVVVYLLDLSKSMDGSYEEVIRMLNTFLKKANPRFDQSAVIVFGGNASIETLPSPINSFDKTTSIINRDFTNIENGLLLASGVFPENVHKRIVVISDCEENSGDALNTIQQLKDRGIDVWLAHVARRSVLETITLERIIMPSKVKQDEMFDIHVKYRSMIPYPVQGNLQIFRDNVLVGTYETEFHPGEGVLKIPQKISEQSGIFNYQVVISSRYDTLAEDNSGFGMVHVIGAPRVLIIDERPQECGQLIDALKSGGIKQIDVVKPEEISDDISLLTRYDAIVISSAPARKFKGDMLALLEDYVQYTGGGLIMLGGEKSFALGGYNGTPVENALPVNMDITKYKIKASVATVIVIDQSGSMEVEASPGVAKIKLANEACCLAVEAMHPDDYVGIIYSNGGPHWVINMTKVQDKNRIYDKVRRQTAEGGGIFVFPSIRMAYDALDGVNAAIKHVILFADAADVDDPNPEVIELASRKRTEGYTLTVVGMGTMQDKDADFLRQLADAGGGRFFITQDVRHLPQIFIEDIMVASRRGLIEESFVPEVVAYSPLLEGIDWDKVPPLDGMVLTEPKPGAEIYLKGIESAPLFAKWQYGLGKSVAFTSDAKARYAKQWLAWDGYKKFWVQVLRWLLRSFGPTEVLVDTKTEGNQGTLTLRAFDIEGRPRSFVDFQATVITPQGENRKVNLIETTPGIYTGYFDVNTTGMHVVCVSEEGKGIVGLAASGLGYSPEYAPERESMFLERFKAEGGKVISPNDSPYTRTYSAITTRREIWRHLLMLSLIIFLIELVVRRLYIPAVLTSLFAELFTPKIRKVEVEIEQKIKISEELLKKVKKYRDVKKVLEFDKQLPNLKLGKKPPIESLPPQSSTTLEELLRRIKRR